MLSINRLSAKQLFARKGRTILTGLAISLGVANILSMLILGSSAGAAMERQARSDFGLADVRAYLEPTADKDQVANEISTLPGVDGVALEKLWELRGTLWGHTMEFHIRGIDAKSSVSARLYKLSEGRLPERIDEAALSSSFARDNEYLVGQTLIISSKAGTRRLRLTGLVNDGPSITSLIAGVYVSPSFVEKYAPKAVTDAAEIAVFAKHGTSKRELLSKIKKLNGVAFARSSDEVLEDAGRQVSSIMAFFGIIGAVSMVIGVILIYTTFSVVAASREQEFGLMKAIGASRRWVRRLVYREAFVMGLIFSVFGIVLGIGMSFALAWLGIKAGMLQGIGLSDIVVSPEAMAISAIAGIVVTIFSALLPARKAGRVMPLSVIKTQPKSEQRVGRSRWLGMVMIVAGIAMVYRFTLTSNPENPQFFLGIGGAISTFLGLAIFMPVLIGPFFSFLERYSLRRTGVSGRLASKNLARQSIRSARIATSILISVSLVVLVAIFSTSAMTSVHRDMQSQVRYDFAVSYPEGEPPVAFPQQLLGDIKRLDGIDIVTTVGSGQVKATRVDSRGHESPLLSEKEPAIKLDSPMVSAIDPTLYSQVSDIQFPQGKDSTKTWKQLEGNYVLVAQNWAKEVHVRPGDTVKLTGKDGKSGEFKVLTYAEAFVLGSHRGFGSIIVSRDNAERYLGITENYDILITLKNGADRGSALRKIKDLLKGTQFEVVTGKQIAEEMENLDRGMQSFFYLILGIAVFISLIGLINTIAMSVLERSREIALLKAVGGTSGQVGLTIVLEASLISMFGAILGIGLSSGIAMLFIKALYAGMMDPPTFTFPTSTIALLLAAVFLVSVIGALVPVRIANRFTPVEALRLD